MGTEAIGRLLLVTGAVIALVGLLLILVGKVPYLGRLPGDILVQKRNFTFYFPLVTMLILSLVLTLVLNLVLRLMGK